MVEEFYRFQQQHFGGDLNAPQQRENLDEIFGDVESCGSFSSDSEEEKLEKVDLQKWKVLMPLKFES